MNLDHEQGDGRDGEGADGRGEGADEQAETRSVGGNDSESAGNVSDTAELSDEAAELSDDETVTKRVLDDLSGQQRLVKNPDTGKVLVANELASYFLFCSYELYHLLLSWFQLYIGKKCSLKSKYYKRKVRTASKPSLFVRGLSRGIWGVSNLSKRNITGKNGKLRATPRKVDCVLGKQFKKCINTSLSIPHRQCLMF